MVEKFRMIELKKVIKAVNKNSIKPCHRDNIHKMPHYPRLR